MDDTQHSKATETKPTGRTYASVDEMLRGEKAPAEIVSGVRKLTNETRFTRMLAALRVKAGLTQAEMGAKMDRTQSAISKLESGRDEELTLADIRDYSKVLNERIGLGFGPPLNHVEAIKVHAMGMRDRMLALAKIAQQDGQLEREVQAFFGEAFFNILGILANCQQQMPNKNEFEFKIEIQSATHIAKSPHTESKAPMLV